jgi:hypothetical protein
MQETGVGFVHKVRLHRRWLSGWLVLALLFAQIAMAAYACPQLGAAQQPAAVMPLSECEGPAHTSGIDEEDGLLCKASCEQGAQVVKASAGFDTAQAAVVLYRAPSLSGRGLISPAPAPTHPAFDRRPPGWPPVYLLHRALRN